MGSAFDNIYVLNKALPVFLYPKKMMGHLARET